MSVRNWGIKAINGGAVEEFLVYSDSANENNREVSESIQLISQSIKQQSNPTAAN